MTEATATKSWADAKGVQTPDRKEVERIKIDTNGKVSVRLIGNVLPRYVYWVVTNEGKRMPQECLEFSRTNEDFNSSDRNPFDEIPENVYNDKPQFSYVCNVIDREDGKIKILDLKRTIYNEILKFAKDPEYGNPADDKTGYNITIEKQKTGPLPQNVKYSCLPARASSPLTEEEKKMDLYELDKMFKRPTYEEQRKWLIDNTSYFVGLEGDEFAGESAEDID